MVETVTKEKRNVLLALIASGKSMREACQMEGMPTRWQIQDLLRNDEIFASQYARACMMRADEIFDEIFEIADSATQENVNAARLQVDTRKWSLARMNPRKYGDKLAIGGADDLPAMKHEDVTPAERMRLRLEEIAKRGRAAGGDDGGAEG